MSNKTKERRDKEKINLRVDPEILDAIDRATKIEGKSRTEFMTQASYKRAEEVLLDRKIVYLDQVDIDYIENPNIEPDPVVVDILTRESRFHG